MRSQIEDLKQIIKDLRSGKPESQPEIDLNVAS